MSTGADPGCTGLSLLCTEALRDEPVGGPGAQPERRARVRFAARARVHTIETPAPILSDDPGDEYGHEYGHEYEHETLRIPDAGVEEREYDWWLDARIQEAGLNRECNRLSHHTPRYGAAPLAVANNRRAGDVPADTRQQQRAGGALLRAAAAAAEAAAAALNAGRSSETQYGDLSAGVDSHGPRTSAAPAGAPAGA